MTELKVHLLGAPRITRQGVTLETGRRKATAVLAYLLLAGQIQRRESLAAFFWPEYSAREGRADLSRVLSVLRKTLGDGWLDADRQTVGPVQETEIWVDVLEFRRLVGLGKGHRHDQDMVCEICLSALREATDLYQGVFMAGFTLADSPDFDDWQGWQAESLRLELAQALAELAQWQALAGNFQAALASAKRRVKLDPLHEPAQRQLMRLYAWAGKRHAAIRQYEACRRVLDAELGLPPEETTRELFQAIQAGRALPLHRGGLEKGPASPAHTLPRQATPFVGRQEQLAQVIALVRDESACRLLTLVGPGGMGKTRLAVEAAYKLRSDAADTFAQGIVFVALAGVKHPGALVPAIVESLKLPGYSGNSPRQQILGYLSQKAMVLVLDNLEHLLGPTHASSTAEMTETVDLLMAILQRAPRVKLLITSRQRLNLQEEWVLEVPGLTVPSSTAVSVNDLALYSAPELFLQRARRARTAFVLTTANAEHVVRICQLVGGAPLGIELAATWVRAMSCGEIVREIEGGLDFLTTSLQDIPERHRSLRTVFEQSWRLLSVEEKSVFRKLSVFRGSFSLRAAERITGATPRLLAVLMDKSLLHRTRAGRYEIHELLRQFAAEKLAASDGEYEEIRDRQASTYALFQEQRRGGFQGPRQQETLAEIMDDIANIRAAWDWAVASKNVDAIGQATECYLLTHWLQGWFAEGERAFDRAFRGLSGVDAAGDLHRRSLSRQACAVLGKLLTGQGFFCVRLGRYEPALPLAQQGISLLRQAGAAYRQDLAYGLILSSIVDEVHGRTVEANEAIEAFLALYRQMGNRWGIGTALVRLGQVARRQGDFEAAQIHLREGISMLKSAGDYKGLAYAMDDLGHVMRSLGSYRQAQRYFEETLERRQALGDREGTILSHKNCGDICLILGQYDLAGQHYQESLALARETGYALKIADSLDGLGAVSRIQKAFERAEQLYRESLIVYQEMGVDRRIALCLVNLGRLALDQDAHEEAEGYLQESIALCRQNGYDREGALGLCYLGLLRLNQEEESARKVAGQTLFQALDEAVRTRFVWAALEILTGLASYFLRYDERQRAASLLVLARHHHGSAQETKDKAAKLLEEVTPLSSNLAAAIPGGSRQLDLWKTAAGLLQEAADEKRYRPVRSN